MQLVEFIIGLAILILVHELGHFLAARFLGVSVEEFGIGFPPRLMGTARDQDGKRRWFRKIPEGLAANQTIFSLNSIPLGGFVRPKGENDPTIPGGLAAANPWVRLGVLFAGPAMNILVGILLAVMLFYTAGDPVPDKVLVRYVAPNSPAETAGLLPGDLFVRVNNQAIKSIENLQVLIDQNRGKPTTIIVQRDGQDVTLTVTPRMNPPEGEGALGIGLDNPRQPTSISRAFGRGVIAVVDYTQNVFLLPVRMMRGQTSPEEGRLVGYKGMFDIYQRLESPLQFFIVISISLGIMNLLPIPALDGGRILLTLPEIFFKKRVPAQYENAIHMIGFAVLVLLLIYINLQDFLNPIQLP